MKPVKYSDSPILWHIQLIITNQFLYWAIFLIISGILQVKFPDVSDVIGSKIGEYASFYFYSTLFQANAAMVAIISAVLAFKIQGPL